MSPAFTFMDDIRVVIVDLDGTLVNAYPAITASFNHTMRALGLKPLDAYTIRRSVGWGDKNLLKPFVEAKDLGRALSIYRRHHALALVKLSKPFRGVKGALSLLKKREYKLGVASNRPTRFSKIILRHTGLDKYMSHVLCGDRVRYMKPHPEILQRLMLQFKASPDNVVFVGDMAIDAQTARRAGVRAVSVITGSDTASELKKQKPWLLIKKITDLPRLI